MSKRKFKVGDIVCWPGHPAAPDQKLGIGIVCTEAECHACQPDLEARVWVKWIINPCSHLPAQTEVYGFGIGNAYPQWATSTLELLGHTEEDFHA